MSDQACDRRDFNVLEHSIPMRSVDSVLLAWEVLDCYEQRRALEMAMREGRAYARGDWRAAARLAAPVLAEIQRRGVCYQSSILQLMRKHDMVPTTELDQAIDLARTRPLGDRLVCHVGMYKAYTTMTTLIRMQMALTSDPGERLQGISTAFRQHALMLYNAQTRDWEATVADHRASGRLLEGLYPLPNPVGIVPGMPCWQLLPTAGGCQDPLIMKEAC